MKLHVLSIVGARPQFVKAAMVVEAIRAHNRQAKAQICHTLLHTGQHYDRNLSDVFFRQMPLPKPKYNLGVGSGKHGEQTAKLLAGIEDVLLKERPDVVVVYGDTNSTLAGALATSKLGIKLAHVEAGLRSFNRTMPEEINRVVTDHLSDLLFCPTDTGIKNLAREGVSRNVYLSGDVMLDAVLNFFAVAEQRSRILQKIGLAPNEYALATVHRAENTDSESNLAGILKFLANVTHTVVFPVHPRTRNRIAELSSLRILAEKLSDHVLMIDPVSYLDMLALEGHARLVMTDSGGVQKEAYFLGVPCLTLRNETEWVETLNGGWNRLVDARSEDAIGVVVCLWKRNGQCPSTARNLSSFGAGKASQVLVQQLVEFMTQAES
jgi:UDP-N-acetylglucosamine 2-epimerase